MNENTTIPVGTPKPHIFRVVLIAFVVLCAVIIGVFTIKSVLLTRVEETSDGNFAEFQLSNRQEESITEEFKAVESSAAEQKVRVEKDMKRAEESVIQNPPPTEVDQFGSGASLIPLIEDISPLENIPGALFELNPR